MTRGRSSFCEKSCIPFLPSAEHFRPNTRTWPISQPRGRTSISRHKPSRDLDNIANIQSSWITQGLKIGQLALLFGANDIGSLMIEENVVAEAGTVHFLTLEQIRDAISELGYVPRQRNVYYELFDEIASNSRSKPIATSPRTHHCP